MATPGQRLREAFGVSDVPQAPAVSADATPSSPGSRLRAAFGVTPTQTGASPAQVDSNSLAQPIAGMQMPVRVANPGNPDGTLLGRTISDFGKSAADASMAMIQGQGQFAPEVIRYLGEAAAGGMRNSFANAGMSGVGDAGAMAMFDATQTAANSIGAITNPLSNIMGTARSYAQMNPVTGATGPLALSPQAQAGLQAMQGPEGTLLPNTLEGFAALAGQQAPMLGTALATGGAGPVVGGIGAGISAASQTMESKVAENLLRGMPLDAALRAASESAVAGGVLEAATARLPVEEILGAARRVAGGVRAGAAQVARGAVSEGIQEGTTEAGQMIEERLRTGDATATDGMGRRVLQAGALGAVLGGGAATGAAGFGAAAGRINRPQASPVPTSNASQTASQSPSQSGSPNEAPLEGQDTNPDVDPPLPLTDAEELAALREEFEAMQDLDTMLRERAATEPTQPSQAAGVSSPSPVEPLGNSEQLGVQDGQAQQTIGEQVVQPEASLPAQAEAVDVRQETARDARGENTLPAEQAAQDLPQREVAGPTVAERGVVGGLDPNTESGRVDPNGTRSANVDSGMGSGGRSTPMRDGGSESDPAQNATPQAARLQGDSRGDVADTVVARDLANIKRQTKSDVTVAPAKSKRQAAVSRRLKDLGVRTVFLNDSSKKAGGVAGGVKGDRVVYLREDLDEKELAPVALHEFGHTLETENPDLHKELVEVMGEARLEEAGQRYRVSLAAQFGEDSNVVERFDTDADYRRNESVGQLLQDLASTDSDVADLIVERPGLMKKLKDWVRKMAASIGASTGPAKDWKLRDAVVKVVTEAEKRADAKAVKKTSWAKSAEGVRSYARERAAAMPRSQAGDMMVDELEGRMRADNETGGELQGMSQFTGSFAKPLKEYPDMKIALQGQPKAVRDMFTFNKDGGMGADLMSSIGANKMVEIARRKVLRAKYANNADAAVRALEQSDNPDDVIVARIAKRADGGKPMPKSFIRPSELSPGDVVTIFGERSVIGEYESGGMVGVGGVLDGLDIAPGMNPIPMDGPMGRAEAPMLQREEEGGFDSTLPFSPSSKGVGEPAIPGGDSRAAGAVGRIMEKAKGATNSLRLERVMSKRTEKQAERILSQQATEAKNAVVAVGNAGLRAERRLTRTEKQLQDARAQLRRAIQTVRMEIRGSKAAAKDGVEQRARAEKAEGVSAARAAQMELARKARAQVYSVAKQLPAEVRGKMLKAVRDANTPREVLNAFAQADEVLGDYEVKQARKLEFKLRSKSRLEIMAPMYRRYMDGRGEPLRAGEVTKLDAITNAWNALQGVKADSGSTSDQLRKAQANYRDAVQDAADLMAAARMHRAMVRNGRAVNIEDKKREVDDRVRTHKMRAAKEMIDGLSTGQDKTKFWDRLIQSQKAIETVASLLDGGDNGPVNSLMSAIRAGDRARAESVYNTMQQADRLARSNGFQSWRDFMVKIGGQAGQANQKRVKITLDRSGGGSETLSIPVSQAMKIYASGKDASTRALLAAGTRFTVQDGGTTYLWSPLLEAEIRSAMPANVLEMYDGLQKLQGVGFSGANLAKFILTGKAAPSETNYTKRTPDKKNKRGTSEPIGGPASGGVLEEMSFLQARTNSTGVIFMGDYVADWVDTVNDQATVSHLAIPINDAHQSLSGGNGLIAVQRVFGKASAEDFAKALRSALQAKAGFDKPEVLAGKQARFLASNISRSITTTMRTVFVNYGSVFRTLGEAQGVEAWARALKAPFDKTLDRALANSPLYRERLTKRYTVVATGIEQGADAVASDGVRPPWIDWKQARDGLMEMGRSLRSGRIKDAATRNLQDVLDANRLSLWAESKTAAVLWKIKENEAKARGLSGDAAMRWTVEQFERSMDRVLGTINPLAMSRMREMGRNGPASLYTAFTSDPDSMFQQLAQAYVARNNPGGKGRLARVLMGMAGNAIWAGLVVSGMGLGREYVKFLLGMIDRDELDEAKKRAAADLIRRSVSDSFPSVVGSVIGEASPMVSLPAARAAGLRDALPESTYQELGRNLLDGGPMVGWSGDVAENIGTLVKRLHNQKPQQGKSLGMSYMNDLLGLAGNAAQGLGVPTAQAREIKKAAEGK